MKVRFKASFANDLRPLKNKSLLEGIKKLIRDVESAQTLSELPNLKKLHGGGAYCRVRLRDRRVGIALEDDVVVLWCAFGKHEQWKTGLLATRGSIHCHLPQWGRR